MKRLLIIPMLLLVGCQASQPKPLTSKMSPEEISSAPALLLCLDQSQYEIPEIDIAIKNKKINCYSELKTHYTKLAKSSNNMDVCGMWAYSEDEIARETLQKEVSKRSLDCGSLLAAKAQQDNLIATQNAIDRLEHHRYINCKHSGCHHY